jgi:hypothetical protein
MIRQFETREDGADTYATYTSNQFYIEVPLGTDEETSNKIDTALLLTALSQIRSSVIRDDVYVNQELVRQDFSITTTEGAALLRELEQAFPDYADYARSSYNLVGKYEGYREPYENASISWYDFEAKPSESLQVAFNASYQDSDIKNWYGLKFDLVTREVLLKVHVNEYANDEPELPVGPKFYAITHSQDSTFTSQWVDAYVLATPKRIREFCAAKGLTYPLPPTKHTECDVVSIWGFVFNKDTLEYGAVKAYARYNQ